MSKHFRLSGRVLVRLAELGVCLPEVLRRAGLPPDLAQQPRPMVTTSELFAFWHAVAEVSGDSAIGLRLCMDSKTENFDPLGLAALATESFGAAMRQTSRYKQLTCPEEIAHVIDGEEWSLQFRWLRAGTIEPEVLTDMCFAWVVMLARHGTGTRLSPLRVEFVRPRPHIRILERHFGCPVVCGAGRNALVFRKTDAELPFVTRNAELLSMLAPQFEEELKQHDRPQSFAERVREAIRRKLTGRRPRIEDIARDLHVSSRSLQRKLQESGLSFQQILEEARHQMARHYLAESMLELNEAAYLLGYEDGNSFVRAFRNWEGMPPAHWRELQRRQLAS